MSDIVLKEVSKSFGAVSVLDKVSMHIESGEFIVFLGPSGCGKSTLLRMIAGLEQVSGGEIHLGGKRVDQLPPNERGVAMVFQNYALYPHLTVFENMAFSLRLARRPKKRSVKGSRRPRASSSLMTILTSGPRNCPAGKDSVSRSAVPSCASPRSFSSTSLSPISMPSYGCRCGWS